MRPSLKSKSSQMKSFKCQVCDQLTFFENLSCVRCQHDLGYIPEDHNLATLDQNEEQLWQPVDGHPRGLTFKKCKNTLDWHACNWLIPATSSDIYCRSCSLNNTIPDLSVTENIPLWIKLEQGKRRLLYSLLRLGLPVVGKAIDQKHGLAFDFLKDLKDDFQETQRVMTGHSAGLITLNLAEADDAEREKRRLNMNEVYRSVLGHFRHESGHYYWQHLIADTQKITGYRKLFGDERENYDKAMANYYQVGATPDWREKHVTAYASSHSWEDWAETWAHYLNIVDSLETATDHGVIITNNQSGQSFSPIDSYWATSFDELLEKWLPLTYALNSINRSSGQSDLYPFVLSRPVIEKLHYVHDVIRNARFS